MNKEKKMQKKKMITTKKYYLKLFFGCLKNGGNYKLTANFL